MAWKDDFQVVHIGLIALSQYQCIYNVKMVLDFPFSAIERRKRPKTHASVAPAS